MELDTFSGQYSSATPLSYKPIRFHKTEICKKKMIKIIFFWRVLWIYLSCSIEKKLKAWNTKTARAASRSATSHSQECNPGWPVWEMPCSSGTLEFSVLRCLVQSMWLELFSSWKYIDKGSRDVKVSGFARSFSSRATVSSFPRHVVCV